MNFGNGTVCQIHHKALMAFWAPSVKAYWPTD